MSKKPLLSEGTARRWAKYAGIQNESNTLLSEMYDKKKMKEAEEAMEEGMHPDDKMEEGMHDDKMEEAMGDEDVLAELEAMLNEQDDEPEEEDDDEPEEGDELDVDAEEAEEETDMDDAAEEAAMMSQEDVEAALKAGLEAMASAVADALKIKIDVRAGDEIEPEADAEEEVMEMDHPMEEGEHEVEEGMHPEMEEGMHPEKEMEEADMYEGIDRDDLVERVMKRVAARLVKESKEG